MRRQRPPTRPFSRVFARKLTLPPAPCPRARESRDVLASRARSTYARSSLLFLFRRQSARDVDRLLHRRHQQHDIDAGYSLLADGQSSGGAAQAARGDRRRDRLPQISQSGGQSQVIAPTILHPWGARDSLNRFVKPIQLSIGTGGEERGRGLEHSDLHGIPKLFAGCPSRRRY